VEVEVGGDTHGFIVAWLLALSASRNDTLGIRTPSSDDARQTITFYTLYCSAVRLVERVRSDTATATVQCFTSIDTFKVECILTSRDTTDRFIYVTGVFGLDERLDGDGATFVTGKNRRSHATATWKIIAYTTAIPEWRQTGTLTIFFSVILLTLECTRDTSLANALCMSRQDASFGVNAAFKHLMKDLFHKRPTKRDDQELRVDVGNKPDI